MESGIRNEVHPELHFLLSLPVRVQMLGHTTGFLPSCKL